MDKAGSGEPYTDEGRDEVSEPNAVGRLEHIEVLKYVWNRHQAKSTSESQT